MLGMILGCIPVAVVLYIVGRGFIRHMVEEYAPDERPVWERRNPEHYGVPSDIHTGKKH